MITETDLVQYWENQARIAEQEFYVEVATRHAIVPTFDSKIIKNQKVRVMRARQKWDHAVTIVYELKKKYEAPQKTPR